MLKPGMYLQERYEIIELIGSGGMADVFKAQCHTLNRLVAIKVLREEFCRNEELVDHFRRSPLHHHGTDRGDHVKELYRQ